MPRPGSAQVVRVDLPPRVPEERRWRYDVIRGDRVEAEATVSMDGSRAGKTIVTLTIDDTFPLIAAINILHEIAAIFHHFGTRSR